MTVIPVVLERWILAGLLAFPAVCVLALTALEGEAGLLFTGIVAVAALIYVVIVFLLERRSLTRAARAARPVPEGARMEPLGRTALRAAAKAALGIVLALLAGLFGYSSSATVVVLGFSLVTSLGAARLRRLERTAGHRLVRVRGEPGVLRAY